MRRITNVFGFNSTNWIFHNGFSARSKSLMMTRKDYVATAEILKNFHDHYSVSDADFITLVYDFADMFAADNPNFHEVKFMQACGLDIMAINS